VPPPSISLHSTLRARRQEQNSTPIRTHRPRNQNRGRLKTRRQQSTSQSHWANRHGNPRKMIGTQSINHTCGGQQTSKAGASAYPPLGKYRAAPASIGSGWFGPATGESCPHDCSARTIKGIIIKSRSKRSPLSLQPTLLAPITQVRAVLCVGCPRVQGHLWMHTEEFLRPVAGTSPAEPAP